MSFTLRYPVSIVSPQSIGTVAGFEVDSLSLSLEDDAGFHVFSVSGFPTADEAVRFADRLWLALMWAVTRRHTAFRVTGKPSVQELAADPDMVGRNLRLNRPVDVLLDTAVPSVFPTSARAAFITGGSVSVSNQLPFDRFADSLSEGIDVAGSLDLTDRLTTALALYNDHHFETSHAAKQVALMTCLEVLAEGRPKHPVAQEFLDR